MELKDFIRQSLTNIEAGVHEANEDFKKSGRGGGDTPFTIPSSDAKGLGARVIEFDVAVTTSSSLEGGSKGKVNILVAEVSAGGGGQHTRESVSRIKFAVALSFGIS